MVSFLNRTTFPTISSGNALATGMERDEQRAEPFDLVVMGVMGPSGGEPFDLSSVASEVLHTTFLPFLVVASRDTPPQTNGRNEA